MEASPALLEEWTAKMEVQLALFLLAELKQYIYYNQTMITLTLPPIRIHSTPVSV